MNNRAPAPLTMANTCYSYVDNDRVVHVASVHRYDAEKKTMVTVASAGGLSAEANALEDDEGRVDHAQVAAAVLKLFPKPRSRATAFVAIENPAAAVALLPAASISARRASASSAAGPP